MGSRGGDGRRRWVVEEEMGGRGECLGGGNGRGGGGEKIGGGEGGGVEDWVRRKKRSRKRWMRGWRELRRKLKLVKEGGGDGRRMRRVA